MFPREMFAVPIEVMVAYAIKFGELVSPNTLKFNGQLYHVVVDHFGFMTVTVTEVPVLSFGWD